MHQVDKHIFKYEEHGSLYVAKCLRSEYPCSKMKSVVYFSYKIKVQEVQNEPLR